ncbi:MAG TPA: hypothetical protein VND54_13630 [Candidatus Saccharimonadales bacterium]|nr:hypothetical protein [Candidatus Saccharimonadales bacterium]
MTITDDRSSTPTPAAAPPSYVRRHPILAAFGVLSGLSLFSALWPVSAVVIGVAVAGHATGLDRAALQLAERLAVRISSSARHRIDPEPAPPTPPAAAPQPSAPATSAPRREAHAPAAPATRSRRDPHAHAPAGHRAVRSRRRATAERQVGSGIDGTGL